MSPSDIGNSSSTAVSGDAGAGDAAARSGAPSAGRSRPFRAGLRGELLAQRRERRLRRQDDDASGPTRVAIDQPRFDRRAVRRPSA